MIIGKKNFDTDNEKCRFKRVGSKESKNNR